MSEQNLPEENVVPGTPSQEGQVDNPVLTPEQQEELNRTGVESEPHQESDKNDADESSE